MAIQRRYLTIDELSEYSGIPVSTLYKKVAQHEIPHIRFGKRPRFDIQAFDAWFQKYQVKAKRKIDPFYTPDVVDRTVPQEIGLITE